MIVNNKLFDKANYNPMYEILKETVYLYDYKLNAVCVKYFNDQENQQKNKKVQDVSPDFYDGFGHDIYN